MQSLDHSKSQINKNIANSACGTHSNLLGFIDWIEQSSNLMSLWFWMGMTTNDNNWIQLILFDDKIVIRLQLTASDCKNSDFLSQNASWKYLWELNHAWWTSRYMCEKILCMLVAHKCMQSKFLSAVNHCSFGVSCPLQFCSNVPVLLLKPKFTVKWHAFLLCCSLSSNMCMFCLHSSFPLPYINMASTRSFEGLFTLSWYQELSPSTSLTRAD